MGLLSSSKSVSTTQQTILNETQNIDTSGVVSDAFLTGREIEYNNEFSEGVENIFSKLIDLTGDAVGAVGDTAKQVVGVSDQAINKVSQRFESAENPFLGTLNKLGAPIAIALVGAIIIGGIYVYRKK